MMSKTSGVLSMHGRCAVKAATNCVNRTGDRIRLNLRKRGVDGREQKVGGNIPADWAASYEG